MSVTDQPVVRKNTCHRVQINSNKARHNKNNLRILTTNQQFAIDAGN